MKCDICQNKLKELFLGKIKGTIMKTPKGKKTICFDCQSKFKDKQEILKNLP